MNNHMTTRLWFCIATTSTILTVFGNDGVYRSSGGVIYPTVETTIRLEREYLSFTCNERSEARVEIRFEFLNPEPQAKKLLVGFQAPAGNGDMDERLAAMNLIRDFRVMQNGQLLPYQLMIADCEDCELRKCPDGRTEPFAGSIYVYLFEVTFEPGSNSVLHSYTFQASGGIMMEADYDYILTTGAKWAGGTIKDLTVDIDMGGDRSFYVRDVFGPSARWSVIGTGRVAELRMGSWAEHTRMVRILSGKLKIHVTDLVPTENINFGIESSSCLSGYYPPNATMREEWNNALCQRYLEQFTDEESPFTANELRLLRNAVYAQYGLAFKDAELDTFYRTFDWYIPDPNLTMNDIPLDDEDKRFIDEIRALEKTP